jgi:PmbA protein
MKTTVRGRKDLQPDEIEFYESTARSLLARNSMDKIEVCKSAYSYGVGVRVVKGGAIGFSFYCDEKGKEDAIKGAVKSARLSTKERYSLPPKAVYPRVKQYDPRIKALSEQDILRMLSEAMQGTTDKAEPSKGEVSASTALTRITNSNGVDAKQEDSLLSVFMSAKKREVVGYDYAEKKNLDVDLAAIGRSAGQWAARAAGGGPVDFHGQVILSVDVLSSFFTSCVLRNLDGEEARRGKALWKPGDPVINARITVTEDPSIPWAMGTLSVDDEGVPTQKKTLIEAGLVKRFLYNSRTANLVGARSTGNGFRGGFINVPAIGPTNLVVSCKERADLYDAREALFVKELMGFHNMNPITGDFSLDIVQGFMVKDGELGRPVKGCMLVGNFLEIMRGDVQFGKTDGGKSFFFSPEISFEARVVSK